MEGRRPTARRGRSLPIPAFYLAAAAARRSRDVAGPRSAPEATQVQADHELGDKNAGRERPDQREGRRPFGLAFDFDLAFATGAAVSGATSGPSASVTALGRAAGMTLKGRETVAFPPSPTLSWRMMSKSYSPGL